MLVFSYVCVKTGRYMLFYINVQSYPLDHHVNNWLIVKRDTLLFKHVVVVSHDNGAQGQFSLPLLP